MERKNFKWLIFLAAIIIASGGAFGLPVMIQNVPSSNCINIQGRLTGDNLGDSATIRFGILEDPNNIGSLRWDSGPLTVPLKNGVFNVELGNDLAKPIPQWVFQGIGTFIDQQGNTIVSGTPPDLYIGAIVNQEPVLPVQRINAVPLAMGLTAGDKSITGNLLIWGQTYAAGMNIWPHGSVLKPGIRALIQKYENGQITLSDLTTQAKAIDPVWADELAVPSTLPVAMMPQEPTWFKDRIDNIDKFNQATTANIATITANQGLLATKDMLADVVTIGKLGEQLKDKFGLDPQGRMQFNGVNIGAASLIGPAGMIGAAGPAGDSLKGVKISADGKLQFQLQSQFDTNAWSDVDNGKLSDQMSGKFALDEAGVLSFAGTAIGSSLKGAKGEAGAQGVQGLQGEQGLIGKGVKAMQYDSGSKQFQFQRDNESSWTSVSSPQFGAMAFKNGLYNFKEMAGDNHGMTFPSGTELQLASQLFYLDAGNALGKQEGMYQYGSDWQLIDVHRSLAASKITGLLQDSQIAAISASKLSGAIQDNQIAAVSASKLRGAIQDNQIAAVSASKLSGAIQDNQIAAVSATKLSGAISDSQITGISASKLSGAIQDSQIAAISGSKVGSGIAASKVYMAGSTSGLDNFIVYDPAPTITIPRRAGNFVMTLPPSITNKYRTIIQGPLSINGSYLYVSPAAGGAWGGWNECIRMDNGSHAAITAPDLGMLFGMHSDGHYYWADTTSNLTPGGKYCMYLSKGGDLQVSGATEAVSPYRRNYIDLKADDDNTAIELRSDWTGGTPYIDFSSNSSVDYDSRIISMGPAQLNIPGKLSLGATGTSGYRLYSSSSIWVNSSIFYTGSLSYQSDERLKKNVETITDALQKVNNIRGVKYDWRTEEYPEKDLPKGKQLGVIAQEVEKVFPELVTLDEKGFRTVAMDKITPVLIEAVKELKSENDSLKAQNTAFETRLKALEEKIK